MNPQQLALLPESLFSFVTWSKSESAIHVDTGVGRGLLSPPACTKDLSGLDMDT